MNNSLDVIYRRSTAEDAEAVFHLIAASVRHLAPEPYSQEVIDTWMAGADTDYYLRDCTDRLIWIAEFAGVPIGMAQASPGEIKRLFIDSDHAGKGIGSRLMELVLNDALPSGTGTVKILALLNAAPFYEKWGFREIARTVLPDRDEGLPPIDIIEMEKVI